MNAQRLRNLTTGRLHTEMGHYYQDIEYLTGEKGVMTHMIPNALRSIKSFLRAKVTDARYWDGAYDPSHEGEFDIAPMDETERAEFWRQYKALPSIFERHPEKPVIVVVAPQPKGTQ